MKNNKVALSGILLGLNMIILFGATMLPGIELTLFAISSFMTAIIVVKASPRSAVLFYAATVLLAGILMPNKLALIPYILFFGYYGVAKYYIEKMPCGKIKDIHKQIIELFMKTTVFIVAFGAGLLIFKGAFISGLSLPDLPVPVISLLCIAAFLVYDYVYTLVIFQINRLIKI